MTQSHDTLADILRAAPVIINRPPWPIEDETMRIIRTHMPIDEMTKEASDKNDKRS